MTFYKCLDCRVTISRKDSRCKICALERLKKDNALSSLYNRTRIIPELVAFNILVKSNGCNNIPMGALLFYHGNMARIKFKL